MQVGALIMRTLESTPFQGTHWSTPNHGRGNPDVAVRYLPHLAGILSAAAPHGDLKLSTDPFFVEKRQLAEPGRTLPWSAYRPTHPARLIASDSPSWTSRL